MAIRRTGPARWRKRWRKWERGGVSGPEEVFRGCGRELPDKKITFKHDGDDTDWDLAANQVISVVLSVVSRFSFGISLISKI